MCGITGVTSVKMALLLSYWWSPLVWPHNLYREVMMSLKMTYMKELQSQWRVFWQRNTKSKANRRALSSTQYGKTVI